MLLANVAQLVEQFTRNEQVAGSNPAISSKKKHSCRVLFFGAISNSLADLIII